MKRSIFALLVTAGVLHCGTDNVDPKPTQTRRPDGGVELPPAPPPLPGCDNTLLPTENACVIHESAGIFVRASAPEGGDGTRLKPLKDLSAAIGAAVTDGRRVYVCAETYEAQLTFGDGVNVFGYFDCSTADWKVTDRRAKIAPKEGVAAIAKGIAKPTRIEGLDIEAADGKAPGDSSIGLIAQDSGGLSFLNTRIAAGKGRDGKNGADAVQLTPSPNAKGADGYFETPTAAAGGLNYTVTRPGGSGACGGAPGHNAGNGGEGAKTGLANCTGIRIGSQCKNNLAGATPNCFEGLYFPGLPETPQATTAMGGTLTSEPLPGNPGNPGGNGANGQAALTMDGFKAGDGTQAMDGEPGQGGGGGASFPHNANCSPGAPSWYGNTGAGGGAGGCPGLAGGAGGGGGASIAIFAVRSPLKLDGRCSLVASNAGAGGRGGARSVPTTGGARGDGPSGNPNTYGAAGGAGGEAGLSGHGSAGYSIGIAWSGAKPNTEVTPTVGTAGAQAMPRGNEAPGAAGLAKDVYEF
jgi:hypothetical protein